MSTQPRAAPSAVYQWICPVMVPIDTQEPERQEYRFFLEALGARIRAMRKQRGWTYRDVLLLHGFHLSAWQGYEKGRFGMSLPSLLRIAKAFGMHPSELLAGLEMPSPPSEAADRPASPQVKVVRKRVGAAKRR